MTKEPELTNPFAAEIRRIIADGRTQAQIAELVGVSQAAVSAWASGDKLPEPQRLPALRAIGVSQAAYEQAQLQKIQRRISDNL